MLGYFNEAQDVTAAALPPTTDGYSGQSPDYIAHDCKDAWGRMISSSILRPPLVINTSTDYLHSPTPRITAIHTPPAPLLTKR